MIVSLKIAYLSLNHFGSAGETMASGNISFARCIHCNPFFFLPTIVSILWRICVYLQISDCVQIVHGLPLLPNNTASNIFLHNSGALWSVSCIFIIGAPAWRWLDEYVTLCKTCKNLLLKQEAITAPSYCHVFFLLAFLEEVFIRDIM